jgi:hypothetical protein
LLAARYSPVQVDAAVAEAYRHRAASDRAALEVRPDRARAEKRQLP